MDAKMKISLNPEWDEIDTARTRILEFLNKNTVPTDRRHSIIMIASELLENAIKYGDSVSGDPVSLELELQNGATFIEVKNKNIHANNKNLRHLDHNIQWIKGFQSPFEAYIEKLKQVSARDLEDSESGLGLVRIAYEGQAELDFYLDENEMLCISAVVNTEY